MNKEEKITSIKGWLQMFGERDNETFNVQLDKWTLSMQYNYDFNEGFELSPYNWCVTSFKHLAKTDLRDRTDEELDDILIELKAIKTVY